MPLVFEFNLQFVCLLLLFLFFSFVFLFCRFCTVDLDSEKRIVSEKMRKDAKRA